MSAASKKTLNTFGEPIGEPMEGHGGDVRALACSPDERLLASGGTDGLLVLWDLATGDVLHKLQTEDLVPAASVPSLGEKARL